MHSRQRTAPIGFDPRGQTSACRNAAGGVCTPAEVFDFMSFDPETVDISKLGDFQMRIPSGMESRLQLSLLLTDSWYLWAPIVVVLCLAMAKVTGRRGANAS